MYTIEKDWKSFNIDLTDLDVKYRADYPSDGSGPDGLIYDGFSADVNLKLRFDAEPSGTEKTNIDAYWNGIGQDTAKTVTGTGTSMTLSAAPNYTLKVGDKLTVGSETRGVDGVTNQTTFTVDTAFTSDPSSAACTIESAESEGYFTQSDAEDSMQQARDDSSTKDWTTDTLNTQQKKMITGSALSAADCRQLIKDFPPT